MIIEKIRSLSQGTVIPKPRATAEFKIRGWARRRGEPALTYWIPNHKTPSRPLIKGITVTEFKIAYDSLLKSRQFTRQWFNANLSACAKEGACNFTTIGGIFQLLGYAQYVCPGTYVLNCAPDSGKSSDDLNAWFDQILAEMLVEEMTGMATRSELDDIIESLDEEKKASYNAALEGLAALFAEKKTNE